MAPTPEKVTLMRAEGVKVDRSWGTSSAFVKWASMATMPKAVSLADWALTREPRRARATVVVKSSMGVDSWEGEGGGPL